MRVVIRLAVSALTIPLYYGFAVAWWELLVWVWNRPSALIPFGAGVLLAAALWIAWLRPRLEFWETLEHELTHAVFSVLFFKGVHGLSAVRGEGGEVVHEGDNVLIRLAPYFFPTVVVVPLLLKPVVIADLRPYVDGLIGFALFYHLVGTAHETSVRQPDIQKSGVIFSFLLINLLHMLFLGIVLVVASKGFGEVPGFLHTAVFSAWDLVTTGQFFRIFE